MFQNLDASASFQCSLYPQWHGEDNDKEITDAQVANEHISHILG